MSPSTLNRGVFPVAVTRLLVLAACMMLLLPAVAGGQSPLSKTQKPAIRAIPLAEHPQGQAMMAEATKRAMLASMNLKFLDKTYENDVYAKDPFGNKYRVACVRFRATSGFGFKIDQPKFSLTKQGLTIEQNISKMSADGLKFKWQLGPCVESVAGFGVVASNVKFVYKARPMLTIEDGGCKLTYNQDPEQLRASIGGLNITGVQNDLDRLAKDAFREAVNFSLDGAYGSLIRKELAKVTAEFCGGKK